MKNENIKMQIYLFLAVTEVAFFIFHFALFLLQ